ncbi:uncharacterized protein METZ01_LOCUS100059 [marine metagenome]|uniref:Uncharacterized protein n=1 Tax=marine metagenome TaxID=408172 RepID=A0A381W3S9_9ZZZZ
MRYNKVPGRKATLLTDSGQSSCPRPGHTVLWWLGQFRTPLS